MKQLKVWRTWEYPLKTLIIVLGMATTVSWVNHRNNFFQNFAWDVSVYTGKMQEFQSGLNPYDFNGHNNRIGVPSRFPYHPYVFQVFRALDLINLSFALTVIYAIVMLYLLKELFDIFGVRKDLQNSRLFFAALVFSVSLATGGAALVGLSSGNIAFILHALLVAQTCRYSRLLLICRLLMQAILYGLLSFTFHFFHN
jgi:hypothetical protein